jgi:alpha-L-fucosidase
MGARLNGGPTMTALPTPRQLAYQDWEFGLFLHFGIRTFYEGYVDWDGKPMSAARFAPSALDCDQWIQTAVAAGMRYAVLTAKHHDGFANWPTQYTDFSVASSPWRDGQGDVVEEFVQACRRHDVHVGLYYSPADWHYPYEDPGAYNDYLAGQLTELCRDYGPLDILWFDGCGSEEREYDWPRLMGVVRELQPQVLVFNMGEPDYRWVGNEAGLAPVPCWNTVDAAGRPVAPDERQDKGAELRWLPAECDCRMRARNWFYSDQDAETVKSLDELLALHSYSVGRGCNLLLNVGPDRRGLLPEPDATRLRELGEALARRFAAPLATLSSFERAGASWTVSFEQPRLVDQLVVYEDIARGEQIQHFSVEAMLAPIGGPSILVYAGESVGHKAICRFPPLTAWGVRFRVLRAAGPVHLHALDLYDAGGR